MKPVQYLIILFASLIKSSITFLVYEVAILFCWFLGIPDTEDHRASFIEVHKFCYRLDIVYILIPITVGIFLYSTYSYITAYNKHYR